MTNATNDNCPLISVLMPYYKFGNLLVEAVNSVLAQTYSNWELVIADDCAPEEPAEKVLGETRDPRIKIFRHEKNMGSGRARNTAASHSAGSLFLPLDSDDLLAPTYMEKTVTALIESGAEAVYTNVQIFGMNESVYQPSTDLCDIFSGHYPHNTFVLKRQAFEAAGGYKNTESIVDTEFWISVIELGTKFVHVPEPLYLYRRHPQSLCQTKPTLARDFYKVMLIHYRSMIPHLEEIFAKMSKSCSKQTPYMPDADIISKYETLHKEFHELLEQYEALHKRSIKSEEILASIPKIGRQISYLGLKRIGLK